MSGQTALFWRIDDRRGAPLAVRLSVLSGGRLQYSAEGQAAEPLLQALRQGGKRLFFADTEVPDGGVLDVFMLQGAAEAVGRVETGCANFRPRPSVVFPNTDRLELEGLAPQELPSDGAGDGTDGAAESNGG